MMFEKIVNQDIEVYTLPGEGQSEFDEVAVYFSSEEWESLNGQQRKLYKEVMMDNYQTLRSLGLVKVKPEIVSKIERGEEPYVRGHQEVKEEELNLYFNEDGDITRNILGEHNISISSTGCVKEDLTVSHDCSGENTTNKKTISKNRNTSIVTKKRTRARKRSHVLSECGKEIGVNEGYVKHQVVEKTYPCLVCGKTFTSHSTFLSHKKVHIEERPPACFEFGKCFNKKGHRVTHKSRHTGEKPFACSECGKCFPSNSHLIKHNRVHTGERPFACSECGRCFATNSYLVQHQRVHTGEKPFACPECGKCFANNSYLVKHKRVHTGERPFICPECGKRFSLNSNLVKHKRVHTGERSFVCSECGKCFTRNSNLVRHKQVHTGERPFPCSECGKCFNQKGNLVKHQRSHIV